VLPMTSFNEDTAIDSMRALEIPGAGFLIPISESNDFLVASGEGPSLTRYSYEAGNFIAGRTLTLSGFGVTDPIRVATVVTPNRGIIAVPGATFFEFDPTTMTVTKETTLEGFVREGFGPAQASTYGRVFRRGSSVYFVYSWWNGSDTAFFPLAETGLVHFDVETGVYTASFLSGCGDLDSGMFDAAGNLLLASAGYGAAASIATPKLTGQTCLVKVQAGATRIDGAQVTQPWVFDGAPLADLLPVSGDAALVRVFEKGQTFAEPVEAAQVAGSASWKWARFSVGSDALTFESSLAPGAVPSTAFKFGDELIAASVSGDYSETSLVRVGRDSVTKGVKISGIAISLIELK
jgi:hypothetical protein